MGKPVVTASIATAYALLRLLNLEPVVPGAGRPAVEYIANKGYLP
jgi:maleate cis-trans isomerase